MKFRDEYRDPEAARRLAGAIRRIATRPWTLMEVCGGQTHAIVRYGLDELLAARHHAGPRARLPGLRHAGRLCRQGDRDRRPAGGDPLLLRRHAARARHERRPARREVARRRRPRRLLAARRARRSPAPIPIARSSSSPSASRPPRPPTPWRSIRRSARACATSRMLVSHVLVPPAMRAILSLPKNRIQGFLAAGHVCTIMGFEEYEPLARRVPRADRRHRLRAARYPRRRLPVRPPARGGPRRGREPVQPLRPPRRATPPAQEIMREVFRVVPPALARHRRDRRKRPRPCRRLSRLRCRDALRRRRPAARRRRASASPASSSAASASRPIARPSARAARPSIRSA